MGGLEILTLAGTGLFPILGGTGGRGYESLRVGPLIELELREKKKRAHRPLREEADGIQWPLAHR